MAPRDPFTDAGLGELFDGGGEKNITINEPKYKFDISFSWLVWLALFFMIIFFRGDPDLHDATIDYIMHKNHKSWLEIHRDYDYRGHKWEMPPALPKEEINNREFIPNDTEF